MADKHHAHHGSSGGVLPAQTGDTDGDLLEWFLIQV